MIEFKDAHIGYDNALLTISSLKLKQGLVYILVGKNGAGKSTLLKTISKQQDLLSGQLLLGGVAIDAIAEKDIARHLSMVSSTFPQVDYLQVREFIGLGRMPHTNALGRLTSVDHKAIDRAIDALHIRKLEHKFTADLSDGERQLVAIARAIAQETDIILLDEPTAFLDYANKMVVLDLLKTIAADLHKCILLSSHDIELSIESECPFLVLPKDDKELQQLLPPIAKKTVLEIAFINYKNEQR